MHYRIYFFSLSCFPPLSLPPPNPPTVLHLSTVPFRKGIPQSCKALSVLYKNVPCYCIITQYSYFSMLQSTLHISQEGSKFIFIHFRLEVRSAALHHKSWHAGLGPQKLGHEWSTSPTDSPTGGEPTHRLTLPWPAILIGAFFGTTGSHVHGILYAWESGQKWRTRVKMKPQGLVNPRIFWATKSLLKWVRYSGAVSHLSSTPTLQHSHEAIWVDGDFFFPTWGPEGK